jgi:hypothetical protein
MAARQVPNYLLYNLCEQQGDGMGWDGMMYVLDWTELNWDGMQEQKKKQSRSTGPHAWDSFV